MGRERKTSLPEGPPPQLKYRLGEILGRFPNKKRRPIKLVLCRELGITENTWNMWANLDKDARFDPPYHAIVHMAGRLGVKPDQLSNLSISAQPIQPDDLFSQGLDAKETEQ